MKRYFNILLVIPLLFSLSSCALFEASNNDKNIVSLGNKDSYVRWNLVSNDNMLSNVKSAYFEFDDENFKYYEDGMLKKEGTHRITYLGFETTNTPLNLTLNFGNDENNFSVYDYINCYTEDSKEDIHQFTIVSEGYHIKPIRSGGVPVRDYHLSEFPYEIGTYVKENYTPYAYQNGKVNYLNSVKLDGTYFDEKGNTFYFVNNSYSPKYNTTEYSNYTAYVRYENIEKNTFIEGTISMSYLDDSSLGKRRNIALIHVLHGENEPGEEKGTYAEADYQLFDFDFNEDNTLSFSSGSYFYDNQECEYDPSNFVGGLYHKLIIMDC